MGFSDTLKDILDQGLAVSRDLASKAGAKAQVWGGKGFEASKDFASKAGAKIQEMGEKGVLMLEIKQLESQAKKLISRLGAEVYSAHVKGVPINAEDPYLKTSLEEIAAVKEIIEKKEAELKTNY
jgi:hypothetical protein